MEFTYRISETEYLAAVKSRRRLLGGGPLKIFIAWAWILACLIMVWLAVLMPAAQRAANRDSQSQTEYSSTVPVNPQSSRPTIASIVILRILDLALLAWLLYPWLLIFRWNGPAAIRKSYWKNPAVQGEITMIVSPESFSSRSSAGTMSQASWSIYEYWIEQGNTFWVIRRSGKAVFLNLAGLADAERAELRAVLSAVLPQRAVPVTSWRDFGPRTLPFLKKKLREFVSSDGRSRSGGTQ